MSFFAFANAQERLYSPRDFVGSPLGDPVVLPYMV